MLPRKENGRGGVLDGPEVLLNGHTDYMYSYIDDESNTLSCKQLYIHTRMDV